MTAKDFAEQEAQARRELWYPDLVDAIVAVAEEDMDEGRHITQRMRATAFFVPAVEFQKRWSSKDPHLVKEVLGLVARSCDGVRKRDATGQPRPSWVPYADKIAASKEHKFRASPLAGSNAEARQAASPERLLAACEERLDAAYHLNVAGQREEAGALLAALLSRGVPVLAPIVADGDESLARARIIECFKQGSKDVRGVEPGSRFAPCDFLPGRAWPHAEPLACEQEAAVAPTPEASPVTTS
jgi:hypothetical protein